MSSLWLVALVLVACGDVDRRMPAAMKVPGAPGGSSSDSVDSRDQDLASLRPPFVLRQASIRGHSGSDLQIDETGRVRWLQAGAQGQGKEIQLKGWTLLPGFIDAHVHLSYYDVRLSLPVRGVFAALDLAAPIDSLAVAPTPGLEILASGPMLTAVSGYPTQSWGRNGYGLELRTLADAKREAARLIEAGARVLKVPFSGEPMLSDEQVRAITELAHQSGRLVAAHALTDALALRARKLGCDILAHTPTEELTPSTVEAWSKGVVISTLVAFGNSEAARKNLKTLKEQGAIILYGTDLGNHLTSGLSLAELEAMVSAGMGPSEVIDAASLAPSRLFSVQVGRFTEGQKARFVGVNGDPVSDLALLSEPKWVFYEDQTIHYRAP